jgi:putative phosphoesterase
MKLGVMSDSHDNVPAVRAAVEAFRQRAVETVVHAGDFISPFALDPLSELGCPVHGVFGNNDGERVVLAERFRKLGEVQPNLLELELGGRRIAAVHYPELAVPLAASGLYDLVIYGHTHLVDERRDQALLVNPGEVGGWLTGRRTAAVVDLESLAVEVFDL